MIYMALALFIALQVADIITTLLILRDGGRELNPVVKWFIDRLGPVAGLLVIKLLACAILSYAVYSGAVNVWIVYALCAVYVYVVGRNLSLVLE